MLRYLCIWELEDGSPLHSEAYKAQQSERSKKYGFQKGNVPKNKIIDSFTDLDISRQKKHQLRKENKQ